MVARVPLHAGQGVHSGPPAHTPPDTSAAPPTPKRPASLLIVQHETLLRSALQELFEAEPTVTVLAATGDEDEALAQVSTTKSAVVLLDAQLPGNRNNDLLRRVLVTADGRARVLLFAGNEDEENVLDSVSAGAVGYLPRTTPPDELVAAVLTLAKGGAILSPPAMANLLRRMAPRLSKQCLRTVPSLDLGGKELTVLRLIATGRTNAEIALQLELHSSTIKGYVGRLLDKFGLRNRVELVGFAYAQRLVEPDIM